jgi:hypothetical protein
MEFVDYTGKKKSMFADGFLKSFGLTSEDEVSTCDAILIVSISKSTVRGGGGGACCGNDGA